MVRDSLLVAGEYHKPGTWLMMAAIVAPNFRTHLTNSINGLISLIFLKNQSVRCLGGSVS